LSHNKIDDDDVPKLLSRWVLMLCISFLCVFG
jgi:hypothetical protein